MSSTPLLSAAEEIGENSEQVKSVEGRSLTQIAWGRLRRDKVAMMLNLDMLINSQLLPPELTEVAIRVNQAMLDVMVAGATGEF